MVVHAVSKKIRAWTQNKMRFQIFLVIRDFNSALIGYLIIVLFEFLKNNDKSTALSEFFYNYESHVRTVAN